MLRSRFAIALLVTVVASTATTAVAEEKTYDPNKIYLVIHSDDAGMSHAVNAATSKAFEAGAISSSSCMVPCPWFPEWAAWAKEHPEYDYGIHLTVNSEWGGYKWGPVAGKDKVPSLCDKAGYLHQGPKEALASVKAHEIEIELRAQIERAKQFGMKITHLDPHIGTLLMRPDLTEIYVNLGIEYGIPVLFSATLTDPESIKDFQGLAEGRFEQLKKALTDANIPVFDTIVMMYDPYSLEARVAKYTEYLHTLKPGFHEFIVHCGYGTEELIGITGNWHIRDGDFHALMDPSFRSEIDKLGIELISFEEFHHLGQQRLALEKK